MPIINIGILAHVDAGKTSLTERLLFAAGVIDSVGSVDDGTTQTDTMALERQRGITIKSAVTSFVIGDVSVNLIDTPGHPDFIAEVERVLSVLDGAILVISAVEGVQAQTRVLMRALQRLRIPTLLFVNKIDRRGAHDERVLQSISEKLSPSAVALGTAGALGTGAAEFLAHGPDDPDFVARLVDLLAEHDDSLLADYIADEAAISYGRLRCKLAQQTRQALVHPLFFGSAITGAGVDALMAGITEFLPTAEDDPAGPASGAVFKVERGPSGEKIAYVRMFSGMLHVRERVQVGQAGEGRVTAIRLFERGAAVQRPALAAGQIGKLWGLSDIQIGDAIGAPPAGQAQRFFAPPTLETIIVPQRPADRGALHAALAQLAEQDPLINLRTDEIHHELFVSLYGEVQKEVIQTTLANEFGIDVEFRETTTICVERPVGVGAAVELLGKAANPFLATVGLRVEPAPIGSGLSFRLDLKVETIPVFVFKAVEEFQRAMQETVEDTLRQGLCGWQVSDCLVTMTHSGYVSPSSSARDFRLLTPLVLMEALKEAGTVVCEPMHRFQLELPAEAFGRLLPVLAQLRAVPYTPVMRGSTCLLEGEIPAVRVHDLQQQLPGISRGEGVLESAFERYKPVRGDPPSRTRTDYNPLNRKEYLLHVLRRV
jgi:ribosomal protection tetracycline resistance protein